MDPDSSFKERFDNDQKVAAVRGTVFDINLDKNYVHTESHAVTIQDEKGVYITSIPAGKVVSAESVLEVQETSTLDTGWQNFNDQKDVLLNEERIKKIEERLAQFGRAPSWIADIQYRIRNFFGFDAFKLPLQIVKTSSGFTLQIDQNKITSKNTSELLALYEQVSLLQASPETLDAKVVLRDSILQILPEKERKKYSESFARSSLFDSWDAIQKNLPNSALLLRKELE